MKESNSTAPGGAVVVTDSPAGRLGVTVCYDLRFPELYQRLRFSQKAQVLLVPSAFTQKTGEAHWEVLLRARAIECQCFVMAAAQAGRHNDKRESYGDAIIINPWGRVIGRCGDSKETGIAVAQLDLRQVEDVRERMPIEGVSSRWRMWCLQSLSCFASGMGCSTGDTMCMDLKGRNRFRHCEESARGSTLL